jgi:hypothetical protein
MPAKEALPDFDAQRLLSTCNVRTCQPATIYEAISQRLSGYRSFYDSYADALARRLLESSRLWQSFVHFKTLPLHYGPLIDPSRS